jgi:hypothetical protein
MWPVMRVASGNFLEAYDFQVFGYYAAAIARTFFPSENQFASLMLTFATFGAGILMRPLSRGGRLLQSIVEPPYQDTSHFNWKAFACRTSQSIRRSIGS